MQGEKKPKPRELLSRSEFKRINDCMAKDWACVLAKHFGDEIRIGKLDDLLVGQIWCIRGYTCVGENAVVKREIISFTFTSGIYANSDRNIDRFYEINNDLSDELATLICQTQKFDVIKKSLAKKLYSKHHGDMLLYHLTIDSYLKSKSGVKPELSDGLMFFCVNESDWSNFQCELLNHESCGTHHANISRAFLCHTKVDKSLVHDVFIELRNAGIKVWMDEVELRGGDSLVDKIGSALQESDYIIAFLSKAAINSRWVQKELNVASTMEISGKRVNLIPIRIDDVEFPVLLSDKVYIDLREEQSRMMEIGKLVLAAGGRFWKLRSQMTYYEAQDIQEKLRYWKLPTIHEADLVQTGMIIANMKVNPFWTDTWINSEVSYVSDGIKHIKCKAADRFAELDCVLVPR